MSGLGEIDAAIDRLDEALRSALLPGLEEPVDPRAADEVAAAAAPYELPAELRRFWERVDPERMEVYTFPRLGGPAHALELQPSLREYGAPPVLLPIDYASHCFGVIELGSEWTDGGTILDWNFDGFAVVAHSLADRLAVLTELLLEDRFDRGDGFVSLDHRAEQQKRLAHLAEYGPHPVYGDMRTIPGELESWPAHWLTTSGIDLRDREPLGATHTIAQLVAAAGEGHVTGRIHGEVTRLIGSAEETLVVVDDGTRAIDVACPAGTSPWGPVHRRRFEFEVTIEGTVGAPPDLDTLPAAVSHHAQQGDIEAAQAAAERFVRDLEDHRPTAVASDIRPLD